MAEPGHLSSSGERRPLSLLSYNIHRCVGMDGRPDAERVAGVIRELRPDLVALQEVARSYGGDWHADQLGFLAAATGMQAIGGPTMQRADGDYGNALLVRGDVREVRRLDLSFPGREPRGALDVEIRFGGAELRVVVTHLGLRPGERRYQVRRLVEAFALSSVRPLLLLGDLNEWLPWGRPARWLHRYFGRLPAPRTFPAPIPLFALDRILVTPREALLDLQAVASRQARRASDHRPLRAVVAVGGAAAGAP